jgi:hypothetical protein
MGEAFTTNQVGRSHGKKKEPQWKGMCVIEVGQSSNGGNKKIVTLPTNN